MVAVDRVHAFIYLDPDARGGDGPLAGTTLGVKDTQPVAGMPWTYGSAKWRDRVATDRGAMTVPTRAQPDASQWADLITAWRVCRHVKSNAVVLVKDGQAVGIGAGQQKRVDSTEIAAKKAAGRATGGEDQAARHQGSEGDDGGGHHSETPRTRARTTRRPACSRHKG